MDLGRAGYIINVVEARTDPEGVRQRLRRLSKSLLGAQFRAEIAASIAVGEPPFWARQMSMQLGIPEHKVASELARFAAEGLLVVISDAGWDRRKLYERSGNASGYWQAGYELVKRAAEEEALRTGTTSDDMMTAYLRSVDLD